MNIFTLMAKVGLDTSGFSNGIDAVRTGADTLKTGLEKGSGLQGFSNKLGQGGKALTTLGKAFAPVSIAAGAALGGAYKSAMDFSDGVAKVSTLVDTAMHPISELNALMLDLSNSTGRSTAEITEAAYQALSASVAYDQLGDFINTATLLSKAGFTTTATAVDGLSTVINAYGKSADEAEKIASILVMTQNKGKTTVDELSGALGRVIPTAAGAGVSFENVATALASLTGQGIQTPQAVTDLNAMLNELADSGSTVGKIIKEQTGQSFQDLMANGESLGDVLQVVQQYATDTGTNFGELWGQTTANAAATDLLNSSFADFNSLMAEVTGNENAVAEGAEKMNTPTEQMHQTLNRVKNSATLLGLTFMQQVAPALDKLAAGITAVTTWFNNLSEGQKKAITAILAVVAVIAPLLLGIGGLLTTISSVITAVGIISPLLAGLSIPIGGIVAAIAAVIAIIAFLVLNWDYLKDRVNEFKTNWSASWAQIKQKASDGAQNVKAQLLKIVEPIAGIIAKFKEGFEKIKGFMENPIENAQKSIGKILEKVKGFFPLNVGRIFENLKLPTFSVTGSPPFGLGGKGTAPKIDVKWNAIAVDTPYMFSGATLFGAGETKDEILYGRENLMRDIREASAGAAIDYELLAFYIAKAIEKLTFKVGEREFARLVKKAVTT